MCDDSRVALKESTGAPEIEIELTPAMIEAGADAMAGYFFDLTDAIGYPEIAGIVFEAMAARSEKNLRVKRRNG